MRKFLGAMLCAAIPLSVSADSHNCSTTQECAQMMLDSLAGLHETDEALARQLEGLANKMVELSNASATGDTAALTAAKKHTDDRFTNIGKGSDTLPEWRPKVGTTCPAGKYMVGATYEVATGRSAGALYHRIEPICRAFK